MAYRDGRHSERARRSPTADRIVPERHFVGDIAAVPAGVAVGEENVLTGGVPLPGHPRRAVAEGAADAVLRVVILVGIERVELVAARQFAAGIATQDKFRGIVDPLPEDC